MAASMRRQGWMNSASNLCQEKSIIAWLLGFVYLYLHFAMGMSRLTLHGGIESLKFKRSTIPSSIKTQGGKVSIPCTYVR